MDIAVNDLVVNSGLEPEGRLIRISRVEPWPVVERATARCHGSMIIFDRLVPAPPAFPDELRQASDDEISQAEHLGLLPLEVDDGSSSDGTSG